MFNIKQLLNKIQKRSVDDEVAISKIAEIIIKNAGGKISSEQILLSGFKIHLRSIPPSMRTNIGIKKEKIINNIREQTGKIIKDIY